MQLLNVPHLWALGESTGVGFLLKKPEPLALCPSPALRLALLDGPYEFHSPPFRLCPFCKWIAKLVALSPDKAKVT